MDNEPIECELEGWSKEEKFELLEALREVGPYNIECIKEYVGSKSCDEIKMALNYYTKKASIVPPMAQKKERKVILPIVPFSRWSKFIIDYYGFDESQTETILALRLIAEFEDKPPPLCTEKIDLQKIYLMIADALEGKPLPSEKNLLAILDKCVVETALTSKAIKRGWPSIKQILKASCNPAAVDVNAFAKPTQENEVAAIRHLCSQKNHNPLNIPEAYLKCAINHQE